MEIENMNNYFIVFCRFILQEIKQFKDSKAKVPGNQKGKSKKL